MAERKGNWFKVFIWLMVASIGGGAAWVYGSRQFKIAKTKREISNIPNLLKKSVNDSLAANSEYMDILSGSYVQYQKLYDRNQYLFDSVVTQYRRRLESEYTIGLFFSDDEINEINRAIHDYANEKIHRIVKSRPVDIHSLTFWNYVVGKNLTTDSSLLEMIGILVKMDYVPLTGLSVKSGKIVLDDGPRSKLIQKFYDAYYINAPNFKASEFAPIRNEYNKNLKEMEQYSADIKRMREIESGVTDVQKQKFTMYQDSLVKRLLEFSK